LTQSVGIVGVALAWVLRVTIDGVLLLFFCNRLIAFTEECFQSVSVQLLLYISLSVITAALLYFIEDINALLGLAVLLSLLSFYLIWSFTLHKDRKSTRLNSSHVSI